MSMRFPSPQSKGLRRAIVAVVCLALTLPWAAAQPAEEMKMTAGKSAVIDYPAEISRISTSNPDIVDAVAVSTREILLHAKDLGICTVVVWSKNGQRSFYNITVEHNVLPLKQVMAETFPSERIEVQAARDSLTLTGRVSSKDVADRAAALAASLAKTVVNNLEIDPEAVSKQIILRVKFAELNRNATQSFGVNLLSTGALNTPGRVTTGQFSPPQASQVTGTIPGGAAGTESSFSLTDALNIFAFRPDINLAATIRYLQTQGVLQILAEPNLVTTDGKEASFLVGGEFPIPVVQGGANVGAVTIQFREFGIRLTFNPSLTANKTVRMAVRPEVSTIDINNSITISGFTIPALATRRIETNIELGLGQSFVIGGLIDDRVTDQMSRIPGLSSIPILGTLFKSRQENKSKTELVVLVTPEVVDPLDPKLTMPEPVMPRQFINPVDFDAGKVSNGSLMNWSDRKDKEAVAGAPAKPASPKAEKKEKKRKQDSAKARAESVREKPVAP
jgi:pilus assembly protein CpaC